MQNNLNFWFERMRKSPEKPSFFEVRIDRDSCDHTFDNRVVPQILHFFGCMPASAARRSVVQPEGQRERLKKSSNGHVKDKYIQSCMSFTEKNRRSKNFRQGHKFW